MAYLHSQLTVDDGSNNAYYVAMSEKPQRYDPVESITSRISSLSTKSGSQLSSYMPSGQNLVHQTPSRTFGDPFYGMSIGPTPSTSPSNSPYQSVSRRNEPSSDLDTKLTTSEMNRYVASTIEPDHAYNASCSAVVDRLVHFLQNNVPSDLRPQEVIKGGSLGKGTAVKNRSDADLVVFLSDPQYDSIAKMKKEMSRVRTVLRRFLEDHGECQITGETQFAVKVQLSCHSGYDLDVDILPTCNILATKSPEAVFSEMRQKSDADKRFYSAPLVKLQMEFVERKISSVTKLRTLVRTVKFWRKTAFEESSARRLPVSYPLELITIGEWEDAGRPRDFDIRKGFYRVLDALTKYQNFRKVWNDNYDSQFNVHSAPYVMDPANPFNNVMDASNSWDQVAERAQRTISSGFSDLQALGIVSWQ
ncbi:hypothetical protein FSP39_016906 [Pinctada imbricata]|uniref:2'-5' oligoadenylate synthase n=1 Tax=Pinctada imbricata TaxID=66713 RepID=A0AA88YEW8_PINIB|nr:hypothetical protein FSP39_016906 [Pinctada imbricata]